MEIAITKRESSLEKSSPAFVFEKMSIEEAKTVSLTMSSESNPNLSKTDLINVAQMISNVSTVRLGLKPRSDSDEEVFLQIIEKDLRKYPKLTQNEALEILDLGLDGKLSSEERTFFSSAVYVHWIEAYIKKRREPALTKHAQLLHQIPDKAITQTHDERLSCAAEIANKYANQRRKDPAHRVSAGSGLYKNLEELGIWQLSDEEKRDMVEAVTGGSKLMDESELRLMCQNIAYNKFIVLLVVKELKLTETGELIALNP